MLSELPISRLHFALNAEHFSPTNFLLCERIFPCMEVDIDILPLPFPHLLCPGDDKKADDFCSEQCVIYSSTSCSAISYLVTGHCGLSLYDQHDDMRLCFQLAFYPKKYWILTLMLSALPHPHPTNAWAGVSGMVV